MQLVKVAVLFVVLVLSSVFVVSGQSVAEPGWFGRLETSLKKAHPEWPTKFTKKDFDGISASMVLRVNAGKSNCLIEIFWPGFSDVPNAIETFRGFRVIYGNRAAKGTVEREIKDYGDQAVIWLNSSGEWKQLQFRREKAIVEISGSAEAIIREVAAIVDADIRKG